MSLVNLAHVCSHLQNASLARLGLTSIPYTKLHLSIALLLHKQGFLSQVKLAGKSPPASCFPATVADNHRITAAPHRDRNPRSGEAALADLVSGRKTEEQLRTEGYEEDAIQFALEARELSKEQLERDGWDLAAINFMMECADMSEQQLEMRGLQPIELDIARQGKERIARARETFRLDLARKNDMYASMGQSQSIIREEQLSEEQVQQRIRAILKKEGFDKATLQHFAGEHRFATPRHLARDGITVSAMGLEIPKQPITIVPEAYRDPLQLEEEGVVTQANRASRRLWLGLKYWDGLPVLRKAKLISKPTKRIWLNSRELGMVVRGNQAGEVKGMRQIGEIMVVSTDRGIMEARECVERRIGGQPLCRIW
ncbi:hypothetical protein M433DRAFT_142528 [Acidomyces richmondensis BFW]|nr:MAG: hypothetical protein FE78DRAFT_78226 [Acidomyces sp. 'richmondensis']KYG46880.1 hypothetical protein M433DRAFT_142528 [Acidomyces richmondensis BFW]